MIKGMPEDQIAEAEEAGKNFIAAQMNRQQRRARK
jgi:hypothetical protein